MMAPLHHHFEQKVGETQVVVRFWIITADVGADRFGQFETSLIECGISGK